ncbi:MAG: DNA-binding NarL/FixJ family response regulator [Crocinitomicaceae bacterium]
MLQEKERTSILQIEVSQKDLENRKLELSGMLQTADRNSSLFEEVNARLINLREQDGDVKEDITQLLQFMRAMSKTDELNTLIEQNSDIIDGKFKERVERQFPKLSKNDLQLMVLMKLGLSTKEIAQLKNVEPASIRIFKHRLKTKLNLTVDVDLYTFINELN